jgi:hypothetical protein
MAGVEGRPRPRQPVSRVLSVCLSYALTRSRRANVSAGGGRSWRQLRSRGPLSGKLKVRLEATYTPTGGDPNTESRKAKLKRRYLLRKGRDFEVEVESLAIAARRWARLHG